MLGFGATCWLAPAAGAAEPQLIVAGGTGAGVPMSYWQGQFNLQNPGNVVYSAMTSLGGLSSFASGSADAALSDLTYAASGVTSPSQPYQYIPVAATGEGFNTNVVAPGGKQINNLILSPTTIGDIFLGKLTTWNAPAIQKLNPGRNLPPAKIRVFYQSEASADSYLLSSYLQAEDANQFDAYLSAIGVAPSSEPATLWPTPAAGQTPAGFPNWGTGDIQPAPSVTAALADVAHTKNSISFSLGPVKPQQRGGLQLAYVVNASGHPTNPTGANVTNALAGLSLSDALNENLTSVFGSVQATAYPLATYSYLVAPCSPSLAASESPPITCSGSNSGTSTYPATSGAELGQFVNYATCTGQDNISALGYGTLPLAFVEGDFADIGAINGATEPDPSGAGSC
jgi:ABC-type phosphate transport system substrate-binding protein